MNKKYIFIGIVVIILLFFFLVVVTKKPLVEPVVLDIETIEGPYEQIHIIGDAPLNGIYDPAIAYNKDGSVGLLTYTSVYGGRKYDDTSIAKSTDNGKTWEYISTVNKAYDGTFTLPNGVQYDGAWVYEVSTIVHDPSDAGREWKVFAHKYFNAQPNHLHIPPSFSIVYKYTSDPKGPWSDEVVLFGAGKFPVDHEPKQINLNALHRDLKEVQAYSEPGALVVDDILYLNLAAISDNGNKQDIILLASNDHAKTWEYVGTLTTNDDAAKFNAKALSGGSMFVIGNTVYLLATPVQTARNPSVKFDGTYVFQFKDISKAELEREGDKLKVLKYIKPLEINSGSHGSGQSTYHQFNFNGGIMFPQVSFDDLPEFAQIFNTNFNIDQDPYTLPIEDVCIPVERPGQTPELIEDLGDGTYIYQNPDGSLFRGKANRCK